MTRLVAPAAWAPRGIESLEKNALEVVRSTTSYTVVAGPGAGKTELLAQRASFLLETGACPPPRRILAISFKRDAARNLRERVQRRSGTALANRFDSFTFDAFAKGVLDQFLPALPERLRPTPQYDVILSLQRPEIEEILRRMSPPPGLGSKADLMALATRDFFETKVPRAPLGREPRELDEWAAREFLYALLRGPRSKLSFALIMRLACYLLATDSRLLRAYRSSYTHAFLDEFQDTTALQYWLTKTLFHGTGAVLTAVGDPQQMIMGWAGAVKGLFSAFDIDFGAKRLPLVRNHRASAQLAPLVRFLAEQMRGAEGDAVRSIAVGSGPPKEACSAVRFEDDGAEAAWIAGEIAALIDGGTNPREIALLARMKAADYTVKVVAALEERGIIARVEDALQDFLVEPIVQGALLALRALATGEPRTHWSNFRSLIGDARGIDLDDGPRWNRLEVELTQARSHLRAVGAPPDNAYAIRALLEQVVEPFLRPVRSRFSQYTRGSFYHDCLGKLSAALAAEAHRGGWRAVLDAVEGVDAVPILTIHKSKGLEYHTVFFVGLEDGAFWNFGKEPDAEMNAFYVAVSRAKARVAFTFSGARTIAGRARQQSFSEIGKIYELLSKAGVHSETRS